MDDPEEGFRSDVAYLLGARREAYELLVDHLRNDSSGSVRASCAEALANDWYPPSVEVFIEALGDEEDEVVIRACMALSRTGDDRTIAPLRHLLRHGSWEVRLRACQALLRLKIADEQVVAAVELLDREPEAAQYNNYVRFFRDHDRNSGSPPTESLTTGELLQATKQAVGAQ